MEGEVKRDIELEVEVEVLVELEVVVLEVVSEVVVLLVVVVEEVLLVVVVEVTLVVVELVSDVDVERELPLEGGRDVETDIDTEVDGRPDEVRGVEADEGVSNDVNCWRRERARDDSDANVLVVVGTDTIELELDEG